MERRISVQWGGSLLFTWSRPDQIAVGGNAADEAHVTGIAFSFRSFVGKVQMETTTGKTIPVFKLL
jgi:hypothetical protein